jgi:type IV pilus assembly protein PilB
MPDDVGGEAPIVKIANQILQRAIHEGASDIHIEPPAGSGESAPLKVRFRVDGVLHEVVSLPAYVAAPLVSRFAVMAELNIAERRVPQSGRLTLRYQERNYEVRIALLPTIRGTRLHGRVIASGGALLGLDSLGLSAPNLARIESLLRQPAGLLLVAGGALSGRTTFLYALLARLNHTGVSVLTIEDPVEIELPGIAQTHVDRKSGLTYATGLRAILDQDPDVILCGGIPDPETADALLRAARQGPLVLAPITAADAAEGLSGLLDLGWSPPAAAKALLGAVGLGLVRRVCEECAQAVEPSPADRDFLQRAGAELPPRLRRGAGCDRCRHTGYRGRIGIHEVLPMGEEMGEILRSGAASPAATRAFAQPSLLQDAAQKVAAGVTTVEEAERATALP